MLGNDEPVASEPCEIVYESEWYDYATKYAEGQARLVIPASIPAAVRSRVRELAVTAFRASGLDYVTLVDRLIHLALERHREKSS